MRWNIEGLNPHVNDLENIHARYNEKDTGSSSSIRQKQPKTENDCPLILLQEIPELCVYPSYMKSYLNYLDCKEKGERKGYNDKKEGADDHQVSNNALTFLTS